MRTNIITMNGLIKSILFSLALLFFSNVKATNYYVNNNSTLGDVFTSENLTCKRPGNGISPMMWKYLIGKISNRSYEEDELIEW